MPTQMVAQFGIPTECWVDFVGNWRLLQSGPDEVVVVVVVVVLLQFSLEGGKIVGFEGILDFHEEEGADALAFFHCWSHE